MHTLFTSIHIPNITTFKTRKTLKHSSRGSTPYPEALEIIKFPVARISVTEPNQAVQGLWCREAACFAPLTDRLRILLKEVQATGIYSYSPEPFLF